MDRKHTLPSGDELATQETTRLVCLTALRILPTGYQLLMANVEGQSKVSDIGFFLFLLLHCLLYIWICSIRAGLAAERLERPTYSSPWKSGCFHHGLLQMSRGAHASFRLTSTGDEESSRVKETVALTGLTASRHG